MTAHEYKLTNEARDKDRAALSAFSHSPGKDALQSILRRFPELTSLEQLGLQPVLSGVLSVVAFDQHAVREL